MRHSGVKPQPLSLFTAVQVIKSKEAQLVAAGRRDLSHAAAALAHKHTMQSKLARAESLMWRIWFLMESFCVLTKTIFALISLHHGGTK